MKELITKTTQTAYTLNCGGVERLELNKNNFTSIEKNHGVYCVNGKSGGEFIECKQFYRLNDARKYAQTIRFTI